MRSGMLTHTMLAKIHARGLTITNSIAKIGSIGPGIGKELYIAISIGDRVQMVLSI